MSWEGQAERALEVISDLSPLYKTGPFISKDSSPSERLSFPSRELHHTQPDSVLLMRELPMKEGAADKPCPAQCLGHKRCDPSGSEEGQCAPGIWCPSVRRSLARYSPGAHKELDRTERLALRFYTSLVQSRPRNYLEEQSPSPPIGFPTRTSTHPMTQRKSNPPNVLM